METNRTMQRYWRTNLTYMVVLLTVWALASYGFGILLVAPMNAFSIAGFPLGFWFAQQGSIYVFVALIFIYYVLMRRLDRKYDMHE
ncbi:MAG: DUF4212 domain-containing protein [Desulfovibrionaceae bacterium]